MEHAHAIGSRQEPRDQCRVVLLKVTVQRNVAQSTLQPFCSGEIGPPERRKWRERRRRGGELGGENGY